MPPGVLQTLPGYDPDVEKNRADGRRIMQRLGYGPDNRLKIRASVRDLPYLRDPAVIMIDQLKQVYIDGELETIATTNWSIDRGRSGKRKKLIWEIERKLAEDGARPIIFYDRRATCWQPRVKGLTLMVNSLFNGWRMEDVWLDR